MDYKEKESKNVIERTLDKILYKGEYKRKGPKKDNGKDCKY